MKLFGRSFIAAGTLAMTAAAVAATDPGYTWQWSPGELTNGTYSLNFSGYLEEGNNGTWMNPGDYLSASQMGAAGALLGPDSVAVVIDPAWIGYDLVAFNATISGIFIVNVIDTTATTYSGNSWVTSQQVGSLFHYQNLGLTGGSNVFTAGPGTMAFAASPDGDGLSSIGAFLPTISNISIAPILTAVNANNPFGVTVTGIPVPEPATFVVVGLGLAALARRRRK